MFEELIDMTASNDGRSGACTDDQVGDRSRIEVWIDSAERDDGGEKEGILRANTDGPVQAEMV